jgi:diadenylate cyclase
MAVVGALLENAPMVIRAVVEIGIIGVVVYSALLFVRGTRGAPVLAGVTILLLLVGGSAKLLNLSVIGWLVAKMWAIVAIFVLIIFQPEIRRALAELGSQQRFGLLRGGAKREREIVDLLVEAMLWLSSHRIGALVAIEREIGMRGVAETGTAINAPIRTELLTTIFFPNTPLHDGGVIIQGDRILAAGCIFPLTDSAELSRSLGTRHRAAVGITEETDAVAVVVSEETGAISVACQGRLLRGLDRNRLQRHLRAHLRRQGTGGTGGTEPRERIKKAS